MSGKLLKLSGTAPRRFLMNLGMQIPLKLTSTLSEFLELDNSDKFLHIAVLYNTLSFSAYSNTLEAFLSLLLDFPIH